MEGKSFWGLPKLEDWRGVLAGTKTVTITSTITALPTQTIIVTTDRGGNTVAETWLPVVDGDQVLRDSDHRCNGLMSSAPENPLRPTDASRQLLCTMHRLSAAAN